MFATVLLITTAYVAGSVNMSIAILRLLGRPDPRTGGSGNPGVSNVVRREGIGTGAMVLGADLARGAILSLLALAFGGGGRTGLVLVALLLGNRYPCFHGFQGGKGVAALLGFCLGVSPVTALAGAIGWLCGYGGIREPFAGSLVMLYVLLGGLMLAMPLTVANLLGLALSFALIMTAHRPNIERWAAGWK